MIKYEAHIFCKCDENAFIDSFYFLSAVFHKDHTPEFDPKQEHAFQFQMHAPEEAEKRQQRERPEHENDPIAMERVLRFEKKDLAQVRFAFTVEIEDDTELDVFSYRYFFLITNQLLRRQDRVLFDCPDTYYHKTGSYFFLQTLSQGQGVLFKHSSEEGIKSLPQRFSLSREWFPAIYLPAQNSEVYETLANPIFKDVTELKGILDKKAEDSGRLDFTNDGGFFARPLKEQYALCLKRYFINWLDGMLAGIDIAERLYSVSGIAQLLFAILCRNFWGKSTGLDKGKIEKLLDICCDFGDCILQVAENIVSHTEGGVLNIRVNDNWGKIKGAFRAKEDVAGNRWYMRISLVDVSGKSILDNIKQKSSITALTLPHIFMEQKAPEGVPPEQYRDTAQEYEKYLNESNQIIHHYGLAVFRNVVNQYGGCFTVRSGTGQAPGEVEQYTLDSDKVRHVAPKDLPHIPGSEYDILLPLDKGILEGTNRLGSPSLLLRPKYIVPPVSRKIKFQEEIFDHFNQPLSDMVRRVRKDKPRQYQDLKECVVQTSAEELAGKLLAGGPKEITDSIFYIFLSDVTEQVFGRTEIVAKIIMQTISELKKQCSQEDCEREWLYIVLYGLSEGRLAQFARQFALFYHRNEGNRLMKGCRLYVVSRDYRAEVMFAGVKLSAISDYSRSRRLVTGTPARISNILEHIAGRNEINSDAGECEELEAFPFELLQRMEEVETSVGEKKLICSPHNKWYHKNLETVLNNDIHGGDLGCRLANVHVGVGKVHLHTFFEGQLLFANTYWYQIFAHYICEMVSNDPKMDGKNILLYGYETYSEQMLFAAAKKLQKKGFNVQYAVFENPKYITSAETSERRVRYIESFLSNCGENICVVYVVGIGTTLATLSERMHMQLECAFQKAKKGELLQQAYKKGLVIVQVSDVKPNGRIKCDRSHYTVSSDMADLSFLPEKVCHYLVEVQTELYPVLECPYCLRAKDFRDELPLIQTNETSTVPMILIKPLTRPDVKIKFKQGKNYCRDFLENRCSARYLYYSHVNRGGNHYQFYVRTAALLNDYLQTNNPMLKAWFREIREKEVEESGEGPHRSRVNIIVSPLHFSNESLIAAVNDFVFDGEAYIINLDVKKEFRDSFVAKFQNYHSALEMLHRESLNSGHEPLELNFYFVDDIILTGTTFNRAKSLISSMLGDFLRGEREKAPDISIHLFKGIILLLNRNSKETLCNYFMPDALEKDAEGCLLLPVYSFIELNTPSIRSYGDSCPICNKVDRIKRLEKESSLTYVERHWREKAKYHGLKKLSDAKSDREQKNHTHEEDPFYLTRGLRRLQCSEHIWALLKTDELTVENAETVLTVEIGSYLRKLDMPEERVEYLISFLKIISREHVLYQEVIQPAALKILLFIFSVFVQEDEMPEGEFYRTVRELICDQTIPGPVYTLYQLVIARLCTMGSTVFCRREQLEACLKTGLRLEKSATAGKTAGETAFSEFLCVQVKKMLFMTRDYAFRVEELQQVLTAWIGEKLKEKGKDEEGELEFLAALYLEAVCDVTRRNFLAGESEDAEQGERRVREQEDKIGTAEYDDLLECFRERTKAERVIMFHTRSQGGLSDDVEYRNIMVLASSKDKGPKRIDMLRSELLEFYRNHDFGKGKPASTLLLDVKDTVHIVRVGTEQEDPAVQNYTRKPCTIAYVRLDYTDYLDGGKTGNVFFAFLYSEMQREQLLPILKHLQGFLSFRHSFKQRIEKDFSGNLFGKRAEETWRIDWLSIEKAGAHTDSSGISKLISDHLEKVQTGILESLFGQENGQTSEHSQFVKLIYNIQIAMYFRAVISDGKDQFMSADNIDENTGAASYYKVRDLLELSEMDNETIKLTFGRGQSAQDINEAHLYGMPSVPSKEDGTWTGGLPEPKRISFRQKYLRAFLVDILCNIQKYGAKNERAEIYIEYRKGAPGYLVFKNQLPKNMKSEEECRAENYKLKQAVEFDHVESDRFRGISLGCIAHCVRRAGELVVSYVFEEGKSYFIIKLPIIEPKDEREENSNGEIAYH